MFASRSRLTAILVWASVLVGPAPGLAEEPGVIVWVEAIPTIADTDSVELPRRTAVEALSILGLVPRSEPAESAPFLSAVAAVGACYASDARLEVCLPALDAALSITPTTVRPNDVSAVGQALAFAAHVYLAGGLSGRARAALEALAVVAPAITLDVAQTPPEVASLLEAVRGTARKVVTVEASPEAAGCDLVIGSERVHAPVSVPSGVARASVLCPDGRRSFDHAVAGQLRVAPWEFALAIVGDQVVAASEADGGQFARALLAAPAAPGWVAVVSCTSGACSASVTRRSGDGVRVASTPAALASDLVEALEPPPAMVTLAPLAPSARVRPWWHWTLLGIGGAALAGGGLAHGLAASTITDDINHGVDAMDTLERETIAFATLYAVGGAAVLTSAILLIIGEEPLAP